MVKKILISSIICLFLGISQTFAGVEYTIGSIGGTTITGFNNGVDNEYYVSTTSYGIGLYNKTGSYINESDGKYSDNIDNSYILYKGEGFIIIENHNNVGQGYYHYISESGSTRAFTYGDSSYWNNYNSQFPLYFLGNSILQYVDGYIYEWTDRSQWNNGWTLTGVTIPRNAFHDRNEKHKIIYNGGNYNIYFDGSSYFLEGFDENGYINFSIFNGISLGFSYLENLFLDDTYKENVVYSKFYTFDGKTNRNYYLSSCYSTGKTITTNTGQYLSNNITFRGFSSLSDLNDISGFNAIDDKYYKNVYQGNWLKQLNYTDFNNFGGECNQTITYGDFTGNVPGYIQYVRSGVLYKYVFDANDLIQFTGNTELGGTGSTATEEFGTGGVIPEEVITEGLFDFDIDNDGDVSVWEYTLAPFTFIKNVVSELYQSMLNIWKFFKAVLEIGNIGLIPQTYASENPLSQIFSKTSDLSTGNLEGGEEITDIMTMTKYGAMFALFFTILIFFIYLRFKS